MSRTYDSEKAAWWREHLARWQASGESVRRYCERHGLTEPNFYRWRRLLAERGGSGRRRSVEPALFVPIEIEKTPPGSRIEVLLASGRRVAVLLGFDAATLAQVLAVLEGPSC